MSNFFNSIFGSSSTTTSDEQRAPSPSSFGQMEFVEEPATTVVPQPQQSKSTVIVPGSLPTKNKASFYKDDLLQKFRNLFAQTIPSKPLFIYSYGELIQRYGFKPTHIFPVLGNVCGENIGASYKKQLFNRVQKEYGRLFDVMIYCSEEITGSMSKNKLDSIVKGFNITELAECRRSSDVTTLNLICTRESVGAILIALYIFCIINNPDITNKTGLLELANGNINTGGLCLYYKYGFKYDPTLYGMDCFADYNNIPMKVDIATDYKVISADNEESIGAANQQLFSILSGKSTGFQKPMICGIRDPKLQLVVGLLLNIQRFLENNQPDNIIESYYSSNDYEYRYQALYEHAGKSLEGVQSLIGQLTTGAAGAGADTAQLVDELYQKSVIPPTTASAAPDSTIVVAPAAPVAVEPMVHNLRRKREPDASSSDDDEKTYDDRADVLKQMATRKKVRMIGGRCGGGGGGGKHPRNDENDDPMENNRYHKRSSTKHHAVIENINNKLSSLYHSSKGTAIDFSSVNPILKDFEMSRRIRRSVKEDESKKKGGRRTLRRRSNTKVFRGGMVELKDVDAASRIIDPSAHVNGQMRPDMFSDRYGLLKGGQRTNTKRNRKNRVVHQTQKKRRGRANV